MVFAIIAKQINNLDTTKNQRFFVYRKNSVLSCIIHLLRIHGEPSVLLYRRSNASPCIANKEVILVYFLVLLLIEYAPSTSRGANQERCPVFFHDLLTFCSA